MEMTMMKALNNPERVLKKNSIFTTVYPYKRTNTIPLDTEFLIAVYFI
ncbi:hypothetical protein ACKA06_12480 [Rossellomorea oryzaecorticis]|uniref:Uncharacterized protein n=1 Tax=Rossellomorea oryzaecorticis TaxID=1396505 RepID=A0ABW8VQH9_9BACI